MGTKTVQFDDLDQTEHSDTAPVMTHSFQLDGAAYEIDLTDTNFGGLSTTLAPYVAAARMATTSAPARSVGRPKATATATASGSAPVRAVTRADREQNAAIRAWATQHGYPVSDRGRIPLAVLDAYHLGGDAGVQALQALLAPAPAAEAEADSATPAPDTNGHATSTKATIPEPATA
jgi:nucleoid-associated protein Lsr2